MTFDLRFEWIKILVNGGNATVFLPFVSFSLCPVSDSPAFNTISDILFFIQLTPEQGDNATKTQGATGSERK